MSQQGLRQASVRAATGTANTYEGDWHALFDSQGIPTGTFNERLLRYLNSVLGASYTNLPEAQAAFAAAQGATNFGSIGTFDAGLNPPATATESWVYADYQLSASFGTGPYTYTDPGVTLPPGITVSSSGLISGPYGLGIPDAGSAGEYDVDILITDSLGATQHKYFTMRVAPDPPRYLTTLGGGTPPVPRGIYSTAHLRSAHTTDICKVYAGAGSQDFMPNANGKLGVHAVLDFWTAQGASGLIHVELYNQGTLGPGASTNALNGTATLRAILDPNAIQDDGFWPFSFTGYEASGSSDRNTNLSISTGLTHNRANHTQVAVIDAMTNQAAFGNNQIVQSIGASGVTRNDMRLGDATTTAGNIGLGVTWGSTPTTQYPTTPIIVPCQRSMLMTGFSTQASSLDGITCPVSGANTFASRLNFRLNESEQTIGASNTSGASTAGKIGSGASGTDTGTPHRHYAMITYDNYVDNAAAGNRTQIWNDLSGIFNLTPTSSYTGQLLVIGSSTPVGYRSYANGLSQRLKTLLDGSTRLDVVGKAGQTMQTINTNSSFFLGGRIALTKNALVAVGQFRNDVDAGDSASTIYNSYLLPFVTAAQAAGYTQDTIFICDLVQTMFTTSEAAKQAVVVALNALIAAGSGVDGFTYIPIASLPEAADYTDTTYFDPDQIHGNDSSVGLLQAIATQIATYVNAYF